MIQTEGVRLDVLMMDFGGSDIEKFNTPPRRAGTSGSSNHLVDNQTMGYTLGYSRVDHFVVDH